MADRREHGTNRNQNTGKQMCVNGHELTPDNTYKHLRDGTPRRDCKACQRERDRKWRHRNSKR